jgi:hypothetical protein
VILDIDGLRRDVFQRALAEGRAPHLSRIVGGVEAAAGLHLDPVSNAPSITFCCQSSIFTGAHPEQHRIMGNQFFDRFGVTNGGVPTHYAFDVGDTLAVDDAARVFMGERGLIGDLIPAEVPTIYERAAARGLRSVVAHNMIGRGATAWLRPNLVDIARFTKGGGLLGITSEQYDGDMISRLIAHLRGLPAPEQPAVITAYFMGLDHHSHEHGAGSQFDYLTRVVDPQVGQLLATLEDLHWLDNTVFAVLSDHGQITVIPDDQHSLRLSFPFDREMGYLFDALGLDVHDLPGEGPNCNAVVACNGGLAHIYLQHRQGHWPAAPRFKDDVLPVAQALWEAALTGRYAPDLREALALVLIRNVERDGWDADYEVFTPEGQFVPIRAYFAAHPEFPAVDAPNRLKHLAAPLSGDLVLLSNYAKGFYFSAPLTGMHGGIHPEDSEAVLSFGFPTGSPEQVVALRATVRAVIEARCRAEDQRRVGVVDMAPAALAVLGWG